MANKIGQEDYALMREKVLLQLHNGKFLTGNGGAFANLKQKK